MQVARGQFNKLDLGRGFVMALVMNIPIDSKHANKVRFKSGVSLMGPKSEAPRHAIY